MAKFDLGLPSYEDTLFSTQEERDERKNTEIIQEISIDDIVDFENHPFEVKMDQDMSKLIDSIYKNGQLVPVLVRPHKEGRGYEMISGHRRRMAFEQLGWDKIKAIVKDVDDDTATVLMVDSNFSREKIKPTELGYAYKMRLEAMKHQGKVLNDEPTSGQLGPMYNTQGRSDQSLAQSLKISRKQLQRYVRLTYLIKPFQDMVNNTEKGSKKMAFNPAVELSFLKEEEQQWVLEEMNYLTLTPSLSQAEKLKEASKNGVLDKALIHTILETKKPNQKEKLVLNEDVNQYFPKGYTEEQKNELIIKLLKNWHKNRERNER